MSFCLELTWNIIFYWNVANFKFNFLMQGHLESWSLDMFFLTVFKNVTMLWVLFCNYIFPFIARMFSRNCLKDFKFRYKLFGLKNFYSCIFLYLLIMLLTILLSIILIVFLVLLFGEIFNQIWVSELQILDILYF